MLHKPVHALLSPASAGLPGDEALDVAIIREDWIRRRVRTHLLLGAERRSSIRYCIRSHCIVTVAHLLSATASAWALSMSMEDRLRKTSPLGSAMIATMSDSFHLSKRYRRSRSPTLSKVHWVQVSASLLSVVI